MTGPMNLISAPARELTPAAGRSGAKGGGCSTEAAPQHAFAQVLDQARQHPQHPRHPVGNADTAAEADSKTTVTSEATTPRPTGLPSFSAAAWGPAREVPSSTAHQTSSSAAVIDLDLVRGMAAGSESPIAAMGEADGASADAEAAETAGQVSTGTDEVDTDAEQVMQTRHPVMPGGEDPAGPSKRGGEVAVSDQTVTPDQTEMPDQPVTTAYPGDLARPAGEVPAPGTGQNLGSNDQVVPDQTPAAPSAVDTNGADAPAEQLADQKMQPASAAPQFGVAAPMQSAENSPNAANTRLHQGAAASTSETQVPLQQTQERAAVHAPAPTGNVEGNAAGSVPSPTLHPSDVITSTDQTPGAGTTAGVIGEAPLAPASNTTTTAPTLPPTSTAQSGAIQSGGVPPTAAPAPAATAQPPAPAATAQPPAPAAPAQPPAPAAPPLQAQLTGPIAQLATGPAGEKVLTVNIAPENLGPVTVRANFSGDSMRIELFAPQDAGREALRGMLTELRRDLAGLGLGSSQVSLGEGDPPSSSSGQPRGDAQMGERSRDPAAGQQPAEDGGPREQQRESSADQLLDQLSGATAGSRLVGSALLPEAPHPVGLDLLA